MSNDFKVGRNNLCGCGSGKKYKKCCLPSSDKALDFSWRKIRQTEGELIDKHLLPYVRTHLPAHTVETAFADLLQDIEVSEDEHDMIFETMFIPWFVFNWIPYSEDIPKKEIAVQYLEHRNYTLSPYQKKMMEAYCNSYFSFYVVLDVVFEESLHLKDIFLGSKHMIKENQATHHVTKGQIIFTRLVTVDDQSIASGIFPYVISPDHHFWLINLRDSLKKQVKRKTLTPSIMRNYDNELRLFCLRFALPSRKAAPEIRNTDNERLQFCTVHFKSLLRPQETLKKLMPLVFNENYKSLLKYAGKDASGEISRIEFSWNKPGNAKIKEWSNTILGHVEIINLSICNVNQAFF